MALKSHYAWGHELRKSRSVVVYYGYLQWLKENNFHKFIEPVQLFADCQIFPVREGRGLFNFWHIHHSYDRLLYDQFEDIDHVGELYVKLAHVWDTAAEALRICWRRNLSFRAGFEVSERKSAETRVAMAYSRKLAKCLDNSWDCFIRYLTSPSSVYRNVLEIDRKVFIKLQNEDKEELAFKSALQFSKCVHTLHRYWWPDVSFYYIGFGG